tara:strand:- start:685 stop:1401 length:717 start_codon:yes stop_codon:yes gene_type:complete
MIEYKERGILIYRKISSENNLFLKFLTDKDEIIHGLCFGGSTKNKKNIYQIGYFLNIIVKKKNKNFPNSISAELSKPYFHNIFNDKYKLQGLLSIISLLNISIVEGQKVNGIFRLSEIMIEIMSYKNKWIIEYFLYLLNLLKLIGYDIDFKKKSQKNFINLETLNFEDFPTSKSVKFPHKLLRNNTIVNIENAEIFFKIFEAVLQNHHLNNMNLNIPINYLRFKNLILNFLSQYEKYK